MAAQGAIAPDGADLRSHASRISRMAMRSRWRVAVAGLLMLAVIIAAHDQSGLGAREHFPPAGKPNFVFVLTDDQDLASFNRHTMPRTFRLIVDRGTTFTRYYDATPLCCPARAALLTGQYGHNNGVLNNTPGYRALRDPANVLPVWLQGAGYRTAFIGKFLNGYEESVGDDTTVAPGWDRWSALVGNGRGYRNFDLAVDGRPDKEVYSGPYLTHVLTRRASDYLRELSGDRPFFVKYVPLAPHVEDNGAPSGGPCSGTAVPAHRDEGRFPAAGLPRLPAVMESDLADKPPIIRRQPRIDTRKLDRIGDLYRCRLQTLAAVDRGVEKLIRVLRETEELEETVFIFASDNGAFHGEHRLASGKGLAYEEAAHLPLAVRVPAGMRIEPAPATVRAPVANIDLAPTLLEWAGARPCSPEGDCRVLDGQSLIPLLSGDRDRWPKRRPILAESRAGKDSFPPGRPISCDYRGVRLGPWLYIRHTASPDPRTGRCEQEVAVELYDHRVDPFELNSVARPGDATAVERRLSGLADELSDCAGIEGRDPPPESGHYCG
jgi:N-acetylglucosamine-6-sulfatase